MTYMALVVRLRCPEWLVLSLRSSLWRNIALFNTEWRFIIVTSDACVTCVFVEVIAEIFDG